MKRGKGMICDLLHSMFSEDAIEACAIKEMLEDVGYLTEHDLYYDDKKLSEMNKRCLALTKSDLNNKKTYTTDNMEKFRKKVDELKTKHKISLYGGLNEVERFAVRGFYYASY